MSLDVLFLVIVNKESKADLVIQFFSYSQNEVFTLIFLFPPQIQSAQHAAPEEENEGNQVRCLPANKIQNWAERNLKQTPTAMASKNLTWQKES